MEKLSSLFLYPGYSQGGRIFIHMTQPRYAPLAEVLTAGRETKRHISLPQQPLVVTFSKYKYITMNVKIYAKSNSLMPKTIGLITIIIFLVALQWTAYTINSMSLFYGKRQQLTRQNEHLSPRYGQIII